MVRPPGGSSPRRDPLPTEAQCLLKLPQPAFDPAFSRAKTAFWPSGTRFECESKGAHPHSNQHSSRLARCLPPGTKPPARGAEREQPASRSVWRPTAPFNCAPIAERPIGDAQNRAGGAAGRFWTSDFNVHAIAATRPHPEHPRTAAVFGSEGQRSADWPTTGEPAGCRKPPHPGLAGLHPTAHARSST